MTENVSLSSKSPSVTVTVNSSDYLKSLKGDFGKNTILDLVVADGQDSDVQRSETL